jgi:hypothetical protein
MHCYQSETDGEKAIPISKASDKPKPTPNFRACWYGRLLSTLGRQEEQLSSFFVFFFSTLYLRPSFYFTSADTLTATLSASLLLLLLLLLPCESSALQRVTFSSSVFSSFLRDKAETHIPGGLQRQPSGTRNHAWACRLQQRFRRGEGAAAQERGVGVKAVGAAAQGDATGYTRRRTHAIA